MFVYGVCRYDPCLQDIVRESPENYKVIKI